MLELAAFPWDGTPGTQGHPGHWVSPPAVASDVPCLPALPEGSELGQAKGLSLLSA